MGCPDAVNGLTVVANFLIITAVLELPSKAQRRQRTLIRVHHVLTPFLSLTVRYRAFAALKFDLQHEVGILLMSLVGR